MFSDLLSVDTTTRKDKRKVTFDDTTKQDVETQNVTSEEEVEYEVQDWDPTERNPPPVCSPRTEFISSEEGEGAPGAVAPGQEEEDQILTSAQKRYQELYGTSEPGIPEFLHQSVSSVSLAGGPLSRLGQSELKRKQLIQSHTQDTLVRDLDLDTWEILQCLDDDRHGKKCWKHIAQHNGVPTFKIENIDYCTARSNSSPFKALVLTHEAFSSYVLGDLNHDLIFIGRCDILNRLIEHGVDVQSKE